jgi:hypothetical protein
MANMKFLDRSIPTWITVFSKIHKVDLKFKTYPNNSMIYSINLQDLGAKELVLVCKNNTDKPVINKK